MAKQTGFLRQSIHAAIPFHLAGDASLGTDFSSPAERSQTRRMVVFTVGVWKVIFWPSSGKSGSRISAD